MVAVVIFVVLVIYLVLVTVVVVVFVVVLFVNLVVVNLVAVVIFVVLVVLVTAVVVLFGVVVIIPVLQQRFLNSSLKSIFLFSGDGPWSNATCLFTEEDLPGAPRNLALLDRTATSLTLEWSRPKYLNGLLKHYTIDVIPKR